MIFHLVIGWFLVSVLMVFLWGHQNRSGNAGIVDVAWSASLAGLALFYAIEGDGWALRRIVIATMAVAWGGRLAWHIYRRSIGKPEDARYTDLRRSWGPRARVKMLEFFQFQAIAAAALSIPFLLTAYHATPFFRPVEWAAIVLWAIAFPLEVLADHQLDVFKRTNTVRDAVCRVGFWNYSRHPNYFFEFLIWVSFALMALPHPNGWVALSAPAMILYFLLRVTGIPATEAQALRSKGDAYRDYQRTTSRFVPWFRKESA